jgi:hypothetical protein
MKINIPEVVAEVSTAFARYEHTVVNSDVTVLDEPFWRSPHIIRYGATELLYGYDEIARFRAARPGTGLARSVERQVITTFGRDFATASIHFQRNGRTGRQMQTWARMPEGWRVAAEHVGNMEEGK